MRITEIVAPGKVFMPFHNEEQNSNGLTRSTVASIVGAGGNADAVAAGCLFKAQGLDWPQALLILGACVTLTSFLASGVRFSASDAAAVARETRARLPRASGKTGEAIPA